MIVTIHQPCFFPYLGIFKKIDMADTLILLDDVQYTKGEYFERNRIKTPSGIQWFKIPLSYSFGDHLNEVGIKNEFQWQTVFANQLRANYQIAPYYHKYINGVEKVIYREHEMLADISTAAMLHINEVFNLTPRIYRSSDIAAEGKKTERLVNLVKAVGGTKYLSGAGGRAYLDEAIFKHEGIEVEYVDFKCPEYPQQHGDPFLPNLSVIDYLFNCGNDIMIWK